MPFRVLTPKSNLKAILFARELDYVALARATGYAPQTIRNVAAGSSRSKRARHKISEMLGVEIWPQAKEAPRPGNFASAAPHESADEPVSSPAPATFPDIPISPTKSNHA